MANRRNKANKGNDEKPNEGLQLSGDELRERLLEAGSEEELTGVREVLKREGIPPGTISATVTRLRKKGKLIFQTALSPYGEGTKPLAVEAIIKDMKLPTIADGGREIFDAGVGYGMKAMVAGVRLAQELSQMGIAQASPVIRMATEMRKAEGMSAVEAGRTAAEEVATNVLGYLSQQKADIATVPNPMQGIVARMVENMFGQMFGMGGPQQGGQGQGQGQGSMSLPPGWSMGQGSESAPVEQPKQ